MSDILPTGSAIMTGLLLLARDLAWEEASIEEFLSYRYRRYCLTIELFFLCSWLRGIALSEPASFVGVRHSTDGQSCHNRATSLHSGLVTRGSPWSLVRRVS